MLNPATFMRAADDPHAAIRHIAVRKRDPGGNQQRLAQVQVVPVLMPRDESPVVGIFAEQRGVVDENVRSDDLFDCIEHTGVRGEIVCPAVKEVRVARLRGIRPGAELLAKAIVGATKPRRLLF